MAPYSPPTGGRAGKLRLDFNENTVGCSPRVIEALRNCLDAGQPHRLPRVRRSASRTLAAFFGVRPGAVRSSPTAPTKPFRSSSTPTWTTATTCCCCAPSYAMYRFYAEVAGAHDSRDRLPQPRPGLPARRSCSTPSRPKRAPSSSPIRTTPPAPASRCSAIERILEARAAAPPC